MTPHSRRSSRSIARNLLRALLLAPVYALPFALFFGTLYGRGFSGYVMAYRVSLVFATSIGLAMWAVRWFVVPRLGEEPESPEGRRGWLHAAAFSGGAIAASYVAAAIVHFTVIPGFLGSARAVAISGMWTLLFVGLFAGINTAIAFYRIAVARARAVERLRAELAEAEVRALRAQIQPHFLFNTLNSIAALVRSDPAAAEETITRLADVFRYALRASERSHARLSEELEFLRDYLAIEQVRFGDRLRVEERVDSGLEDVAVPTLLLQPIVENAVKHGVSTRAEGGRVSLEVRDAGDRVIVEIADDGPGMNGSAPSGEGFGLHSVRERVRAAGPPHELVIESSRAQGTRVRITLPKTPSASLTKTPSASLPQTPSASLSQTPAASPSRTPPTSPSQTPRPTHPGATP